MVEIPDWAGRARVVMLGKPGCRLCADAWDVITTVTDGLGASRAEADLGEVGESEYEEYWDKIPVTFVDGRRHDFWRVNGERLRRALSH